MRLSGSLASWCKELKEAARGFITLRTIEMQGTLAD